MKQVNIDESIETILKNNSENDYLFFYFTAKWCGPCQKISPLIEKLAEDNERSDLKYYKVDIDNDFNDDLCEKCKVEKIPSYTIIKHNKILETQTGGDINIPLKMLSDHLL